MFENGMIRRTLLLSRNEVKGSSRILHNEEFRNLYSSPNIRVDKSKRIRWAEHVARTGRRKMHTKFWLSGLNGRNH
jgi:hypothetical protein